MFYFLSASATAALNRAELLRELGHYLQTSGRQQVGLAAEDYPTWGSIFRLLVSLAGERPLAVILDEFQYLMGDTDDIVSQLAAVWDREARGKRLTLVLCGSQVSTMRNLGAGGSPLFGRLSWAWQLRPFDYRDAARMVPDRPPREAATLYGTLGGTPQYLSAVPAAVPLGAVMSDLVLSPRGHVRIQLETLIEQEQGIRQPAEYRAVLAAIAGGHTERNAIAQAAGLRDRPHVARHALDVLEALELVWREQSFGDKPNAPARYRVADPAVRFWYQFVHKNRSSLEMGDPHAVWEARVAPQLGEYMGKVFERIAAQGYARCHESLGLPAAGRWSRFEGSDRSRRPIEIDVVAELEDGRVLTGEVKWSSQPVEYDLHLALLRDLESLAASGKSWAHAALAESESAGHIYFSAAGFTRLFEQKAAESGRIRLVSLAELYA